MYKTTNAICHAPPNFRFFTELNNKTVLTGLWFSANFKLNWPNIAVYVSEHDLLITTVATKQKHNMTWYCDVTCWTNTCCVIETGTGWISGNSHQSRRWRPNFIPITHHQRHLAATSGTYLELPLCRHHLGVGAGNLDPGEQTRSVMRLDDVATVDLVGTDAAVVGTWRKCR